MDKCVGHLSEYISKEESNNRINDALRANSAYYTDLLKHQLEDHMNVQELLISRYGRADGFLNYVWSRICKLAKTKKSKLNYSWNEALDFRDPRSEKCQEACVQVEILLQMGIDFQTLLNTIKNDELLRNQWRGIVMTMRLAGYDSFDKTKDI
jgi:hypothetical protein